jgi:hypothetical protein
MSFKEPALLTKALAVIEFYPRQNLEPYGRL